MKKFKGILWDCDGCIMDSEHLACGVFARFLTDAGYAITTEEFIRQFCGQGKRHIRDTILAAAGFDALEMIDDAAKTKEQNRLFTEELKAIDGVPRILETIDLPRAIASGSEYDRLYFTLDLINLRQSFGEHIYSASDVKKGKPAPDIFLYAAEKLGIPPEGCLVIEDSLNGVRAGKAAGMTVFGFTGGSHVLDKNAHAAELMELGADWVFHSMEELEDFLQQIVNPQNSAAQSFGENNDQAAAYSLEQLKKNSGLNL